MAKCDVGIEIDEPRETYRGGDRISGHVVVTTDEPVKSKGVEVRLRQLVHGKGNRQQIDTQTQQVFVGDLPSGTTRYAFSFELPNGPVSYVGHYLNIDWAIHATIDIPWKIDPKVDHMFRLGFNPDLPHVEQETKDLPEMLQKIVEERQGPGSAATLKKTGIGCVLLFLLPFLAVGVGAITFGFLREEYFLFLPGGMFLLVPLLILGVVIRQQMASSRLGPVNATLVPAAAIPGEEVRFQLHFSPSRETQINAINAKLVGREKVVRGSGTNKKTFKHELHSEVLQLPRSERLLRAGERLSTEATFRVPPDAAATFHAPSNDLDWTVSYEIDVHRWPDFSGSEELIVRPS